MKTFGDKVKSRREELGLTQEELAKKTGYKDKSGINKIETNKNNIKQSKIAVLANALDVSPDYFFIDDEELKIEAEKRGFPTSISTFENDLIATGFPLKEYLSLSKEDQRQVVTSIKLIIAGLIKRDE